MLYYGTEDKVPELLRSGGHELAAGVASAGSSIGQGLAVGFEHQREDKRRKEQELKDEAKLTQHARGILDVLDPENKHTNSQLSGDEARGRAAGLYQRNLMDKYAAEIAADKAKTEAAATAHRDLQGFAEDFAHGLRGGTSAAPPEAQADYYENPEKYPAGPPRPTPRDAMTSALEKYPGAATHPQFDNTFSAVLKAFGPGQADQYVPSGGTVKIGDLSVPYITRDNKTIAPLPEFVKDNPKYSPKKKSGRAPGKGPLVSEDGKFYWDPAVETWKPAPSHANEDIMNFLKPGQGGQPGKPAAPAEPTPPDAIYVPGKGLVKPRLY